jgi:hypothetical protein
VTTGYLPAAAAVGRVCSVVCRPRLALLILDGFLSALPEEAREAVLQRTVDMVARGL